MFNCVEHLIDGCAWMSVINLFCFFFDNIYFCNGNVVLYHLVEELYLDFYLM